MVHVTALDIQVSLRYQMAHLSGLIVLQHSCLWESCIQVLELSHFSWILIKLVEVDLINDSQNGICD